MLLVIRRNENCCLVHGHLPNILFSLDSFHFFFFFMREILWALDLTSTKALAAGREDWKMVLLRWRWCIGLEKQGRAKRKAGWFNENEAERRYFHESMSNPFVERPSSFIKTRELRGKTQKKVTKKTPNHPSLNTNNQPKPNLNYPHMWLQGAAQDVKLGGNSRHLYGWTGPEVQELKGLPVCPLLTCLRDHPWYTTRLIPFSLWQR